MSEELSIEMRVYDSSAADLCKWIRELTRERDEARETGKGLVYWLRAVKCPELAGDIERKHPWLK